MPAGMARQNFGPQLFEGTLVPAYLDLSVASFLQTSDDEILAELHRAYASDGFLSQYTSQTIAWEATLGPLKEGLHRALEARREAAEWRVLLELPLYRLRRRVDLLLVARQAVAVLELKVGESRFRSPDRRQVEEYALDLRDFHEHSHLAPILPVLWCTEADPRPQYLPALVPGVSERVVEIGAGQFSGFVTQFADRIAALPARVREDWSQGAYKPVPSVIEAATTLFSGHGVEDIAQADAANLDQAAEAIVSIIEDAKRDGRRAVVFLTGVPGSGKTLAGLQVVHRTVVSPEESAEVVYLSGNTPLVTVLREALTEDEYARRSQEGAGTKKGVIRSSVRARIQHIMDFLKEYLSDPDERPPHERAIIFDEAQRAWNAAYGKQKFGRSASEPRLLLDIMSRHPEWSVIVGLIGGGQEINSGENGMAEWGDALRSLPRSERLRWEVFGPPGMADGDQASAFLGLGDLTDTRVTEVPNLTLQVPLRSFRSPRVADWVAAVLDGEREKARDIMNEVGDYPIRLTRDLSAARAWLQRRGRGERRYGLVASSTASRLRAYGLGVSLNATDGKNIAHWYLKPRGDVRSSFALEVTANEYTTQGLELDFVGLCWGGDLQMTRDGWMTRRFSGTAWTNAQNDRRRFVLNSYRVLMTRAREGLVFWIPRGDAGDATRRPVDYDRTAAFLSECGATDLGG